MENEIGDDEPDRSASPVWCMVGNIVEDRPYGPGGLERRSGTKHFRAGAKVYCFPPLWGDGYRKIKVIGHHRKSNKLVTMVIDSKWIVNRRAELVYSPAIIRRFEGRWDGADRSRSLAERLAGSGGDFQSDRNTNSNRSVMMIAAIAGGVIGFTINGIVG